MARSGRFGNLPGRAPDLTNTIVALMEQYESARDRNILSAWMNGGKFEGKKVTDGRIRNWFKMRRSQYGKDDPEYDYWDQQLDQIDYQIGESKMLLSFEQGKIKEGGASAWYRSNAKRFPKNSEAWREAMRNAARFKKAAQEKSRAARTVSNSEKYQRETDAIRRKYIAPAEEAMRILDKAVRKSGLQPGGKTAGFMDLDITALAGDELLREFLRLPEGRRLAKQWERATGEKFSYRSLRQVLNGARRGAERAADVARKYGYESYVPSWESQARQWEDVTTQTNVFTSDIGDRYTDKAGTYYKKYSEATTAKDRQRLRNKYANYLEKEIKRADRAGDDVLSGALRNELRSLRGEDPVSNAEGIAFGGGSSGQGVAQTLFEVQYDKQGQPKYVYTQGVSVVEQQTNEANRDAEIIASHKAKDGKWAYIINPDTGFREDVNVEEMVGDAGDPRAAGYVVNTGDDGVDIFIKVDDLQMRDPATGELVGIPNTFVYTTIDGEVRYQYPGPTGEMIDSSQPPFDIDVYEDGEDRTPPGFIFNDDTNQPEPIFEVEGNVLTFSDVYVRDVLMPETARALETQDTAKVSAALPQAALADLTGRYSPEQGRDVTVQIDTETGLPVTEAEVRARSEATAPVETQVNEDTGEEERVRTDTGEALEEGRPRIIEIANLLGIDPSTISRDAADMIEMAYNNVLAGPGGSIQMADVAWGEMSEDDRRALAESLATANDVVLKQDDGSFVVNTDSYPTGTETDVMGQPIYEEGDIVMESPASVAQVQVEEAANVETRVISQPWVLNDTGTTTDLSGRFSQYYSPNGRKRLAAMPAEVRLNEVIIPTMLANDADPNDPAQMRVYTDEMDILTASGEAGEDEWLYIVSVGAGAPEGENDAIGWNLTRRAVVDANVSPGVSVTDLAGVAGPAFIDGLKDAGWTDEQIREEGWGSDLDQWNERESQRQQDNQGPTGYEEPGDYSFEGDGPTTLDTGTAESIIPGQKRGSQLGLRAAIAGVVAGATVPDPALAQANAARRGGAFGPADPRLQAYVGGAYTPKPKMQTKTTKPVIDPVTNQPTTVINPGLAPDLKDEGGFKLPWEPGGFFNPTPKQPSVANVPQAPKYDPLSSIAYNTPKPSTPATPSPSSATKTSYTWDGPSGYEEKGDYSWED